MNFKMKNYIIHQIYYIIHQTYLKAIIDQSNIDLTNLIESCNENVSNYINRLDILTSNIEVLSDNIIK